MRPTDTLLQQLSEIGFLFIFNQYYTASQRMNHPITRIAIQLTEMEYFCSDGCNGCIHNKIIASVWFNFFEFPSYPLKVFITTLESSLGPYNWNWQRIAIRSIFLSYVDDADDADDQLKPPQYLQITIIIIIAL